MYIGLTNLGLNALASALSPVYDIFRNGEPGTVFIAQKPSDVYARKNLLLQTAVLSTQTVALQPGATYTLSGGGTGTVTLSGGSTGVFTAPTSLTFTPTSSSVTLTVAGSVTTAQLEKGSSATAYQAVTDWVTEYLAAVGSLITQWTDDLGTTPVTALEQTIGLQQDVRPIFYGPSPLTQAGWVTMNADAITAASASQVSGTPSGGLVFGAKQTVALTAGTTYKLTASWSGASSDPSDGVTIAFRDSAGSVVQGTQYQVAGTPSGNNNSNPATFTPSSSGNYTVTLVATFATAGSAGTVTFRGVTEQAKISAPNTVGQPLYGPELVTNQGPFTATTGWSAVNGTVSVSGTRLRVTSSGAGTVTMRMLQTYTDSGSGRYAGYISIAANSNARTPTVFVRGTAVALRTGTATAVCVYGGNVVAGNNTETCSLQFVAVGAGEYIEIDFASCKYSYGNHRSQSTAGNRAKLSARYNKVTVPNANPTSAATAGFATGTDGAGTPTVTVSVVSDTAALAAAGLSSLCSLGNVYKIDYTGVVSYWFVQLPGTAGNALNQRVFAYMRGTTCAMGLSGGGATTANFAGGAGYQAVSGTATNALGSGARLQIGGGAGSGTVYFILPDMRESCYSYLPTPQVVWDSTTGYDDTGFPARIVYSGAQGYATGSVDFSANQQLQVFAAAAKLSDAAFQSLMELTANATSTDGGFVVGYANGLPPNYIAFSCRGTTSQASRTATSAASAAPLTAVLSSAYDISQSTIALQVSPRLNGVAPTTSDSAATTPGYFANASLYSGARGGTGSYFTGDEFISIVRGGSTPSTTGTIYPLEQWCGRFAYLYF